MESLIKELKIYTDLLNEDTQKITKGNKASTVRFRRNLRHMKKIINALKIETYDAEIACL